MRQYRYFDPGKYPDHKLKDCDPLLISMLDLARHEAGHPFYIVSGKRTVEENFRVGGVPDSAHLKGYAADIRCHDSMALNRILRGVHRAGFRRIGMNGALEHRDFKIVAVHVDIDPSKSDATWIKIYRYNDITP